MNENRLEKSFACIICLFCLPYLHRDGIYIGETIGAFCTRCKGHMRDVNLKNLA